MAKQRREIEVFTVSSLNLLSKALGAVILLFIIIPKVTFKQRNLLDHLPVSLDSLAKNPNMLFYKGDSVGMMLLVDSSLLNLKNQKRKIDSLLEKLNGIKETAKSGQYQYQKPVVKRDSIINIDLCKTDKEPPVFKNCPSDMSKKMNGKCTKVTWSAPSVQDNCTIPTVLMVTSPTANLENGGCFPEGTTMVTYTAKDLKGNQSQCRFAVIINKDAKPTPERRDTSVVERNTDKPPFPCNDPVCIYLEWKGDKDAKVEMSAQHDGKWSGYENFGDGREWMQVSRIGSKAGFKLMMQKGKLTTGDYAVQAYLRSGLSATVSGVVIMNKSDGTTLWRKLPEASLTKSQKSIVGTVGLQTDHIEIK